TTVERLTPSAPMKPNLFPPRLALAVTIGSGEDSVGVIVTHFGLTRRARLGGAATVRTLAANRAFALGGELLLGDLNATPEDECIRSLVSPPGSPEQSWLDAVRAAGIDRRDSRSWPSFAPLRRLDYILARPVEGWTVLECRRLPAGGSDHLGVFARLRWSAG